MKVLSSDQIKAADQFTIANEPISSLALMERACENFTNHFFTIYSAEYPIWIFCGTGNNGGDGLGIARLLFNKGYRVKVFIVGDPAAGSADFTENFKRLPPQVGINTVEEELAETPPDNAVIVDAIFGTGLNRPASGIHAAVISTLNAWPQTKVAVDVPSGLFCEKPQAGAPAIMATQTISFQAPKLAFFMPENHQYVGEWTIANIGLSPKYIDTVPSNYYFQLAGEPDLLLPRRKPFMHKGDAGKVLLVGGSKGKIGAILLASRACLRSGTGLLSVLAPECVTIPLHVSTPEAMLLDEPDKDRITTIEKGLPDKFDAVGVGPGMGTAPPTAKAFHELIKSCSRPMVLDADAINLLAENRDWLNILPEKSILTPHPGEFKRLVGGWANDYERLEKLLQLARQHQLVVVLKGAFTSICTPEGKVWFNSTGNPGMATGGSGDVLTGVITALLGQGFSPENSARMGVFLHGLAGDMAALEKGHFGLIASDIINKLPQAFQKSTSKAD